MVKIIFFDVDGTLISLGKHKISSKTHRALLSLNKKGIKIIITTGRGPLTAPHFDGIRIDGYITFNGSYTFFNDSDLIIKHPINKNSVIKIIDNARKLNKGIAISNENSLLSDCVDSDLIKYFSPAKEVPTMVNNLKEFLNADIYQIMISSSVNDRKEILSDVYDVVATFWCDYAADYIPKECNKGSAIKEVLKYFKIDKSEAMAFGDGMNDISMFNAVKYSIAMDDASDEVKKCAKEITNSALNDGVYNYLKIKGLI